MVADAELLELIHLAGIGSATRGATQIAVPIAVLQEIVEELIDHRKWTRERIAMGEAR